MPASSLRVRGSRRIERHVALNETLPRESNYLLQEVLMRREFERGEAERIAHMLKRSARRILREFTDAGLLASETPKGPVSLRFPVDSLDSLFPRLGSDSARYANRNEIIDLEPSQPAKALAGGPGRRFGLCNREDRLNSVAALGRLRAALLNLPDSGEAGFEGLVGALLGAVTQSSFRIAVSGSQFGQDGANDSDNIISYEAKLYRGRLNKAALLNKAAEAASKAQPPNLWCLAATSGASTQIVEALRNLLSLSETSLLILDWPANDPLPPLALLCAMAPQTLIQFVEAWQHAVVDLADVTDALGVLSAEPAFPKRAAAMRETLEDPDIGVALALHANRAMLQSSFADVQVARQRFDQPLAPAAHFALETIDRSNRAAVDALFTDVPTLELAVLTGNQGCGKSWSVAQAWLAQPDPPFTIFLTAARAAAAEGRDPQAVVAECLIEQCGAMVTEASLRRWQQRFSRWATHVALTPRIVIVVDGLNERARMDWAPWLSRLASFTATVGGRVIVTSRERYFKRVEAGLGIASRKIPIGELSNRELDACLSRHGIGAAEIAARVRPSLRNPRILGIAFDLLSTDQIRSADELSIERLLFEHLRASQVDRNAGEQPGQFIRLLAEHARTIRERIESDVEQDRLLFDSYDHVHAPRYNIPADLLPVIEERFFEPVVGDPTLYQLSDDGLIYALGIATLRELQAAERNGRSVRERLTDLVEPIAALDMSSEMVFAACLVASVDDQISDEIAVALIERYITQQNIDDGNYPAYVGIVRNRPAAALDALFVIDTQSRPTANKEWLIGALRDVRSDAAVRDLILARADRWLRFYTLDPARTMMPGERSEAQRQQKLAESQEKIDRRMCELTGCERALLGTMVREDSIDTAELSEDIFMILAGLPLATLAAALSSWALGRALNGGYRVPWRDYGFVIQHNCADWFETRAALLGAADCFGSDTASRAGRWALVYVLRATGDEADSERAEAVVATLVEDNRYHGGWRQAERYCATDPCDPDSERPDNIDATAALYAALDPATIAINRARTEVDMTFRDALPGLARFAPDVAIAVQRAMGDELVRRAGPVAVYSLNWLTSAAVLFEPPSLEAMLARACELSHPEIEHDPDGSEDWVASQNYLQAVLSHRTGDQQLEAMRALPPHGPPLLELERVFSSASGEALLEAFDYAMASGEEYRLLLILAFANRSATPLSMEVLSQIRGLTAHARSSVRALAMQISAEHPDAGQLRDFCDSGWSALALGDEERFFERMYGSSMIIAAAGRGIIAPEEALSRITPERYSEAVEQLGRAATGAALGALLRAAFERLLRAKLPFTPPQVSQVKVTNDGVGLFSLVEDDVELTIEQFFERLSESDETFSARHDQGWERFREFQTSLSSVGADLVIRDLGQPAIAAIADQDLACLQAIAKQILALSKAETGRAVNLGAYIGRALSAEAPELATTLFRAIDGSRSYVRVTYGLAKIPLLVWESWHAAPGDAIRKYWRERLEGAENDDMLAAEVIAAQRAGQKPFVEAVALEAIGTGHPVAIARGLTILGFLDQSAVADEALARFVDGNGLVGRAAAAARGTAARNRWSRHWYEQAATTEDKEYFWRASVLLTKIADGRCELWGEDAPAGSVIGSFGWSLTRPLERRIADWEKKRKKTLFGAECPRSLYLEQPS